MLSSFAYRLIHTVIAARAFDAGIEVLEGIGRLHFRDRTGVLQAGRGYPVIMLRLWL
ncbi:MAG: hypothetical protein ABR903_04485 [Thermodesulfovibrionales bacterium]|jgi:hypothetical protein